MTKKNEEVKNIDEVTAEEIERVTITAQPKSRNA